MSRVNNVRFKQFQQQARGAKIFEIHVSREDKQNSVLLKFYGKAPRAKKRVTGEWTIARAEREASAVDEDVKSFLTMARKSFLVHRAAGLEDDQFASPEELEKAKEEASEG